MSLIKTGSGITDIRGGFGGVYFTRDKSGLHSSAKPRRVHQKTSAQRAQRNAFIKARTFCKNEVFSDKPPGWLNRCVSYNIYRALNDLDVGFFYAVTGELDPDTTCNYWYDGVLNGKPYYRRGDGAWFIWWEGAFLWIISSELGNEFMPHWARYDPNIEGEYVPLDGVVGIATVTLSSTEPPDDYQIPGM